VTCIHDNFANVHTNRAYVRLEQTGRMPCRLRLYPYVKNLQTCQMAVEQMRRYKRPLVRIQGIKLAVDGYALMYDILPEHRHLAIPMHPQPLFEQIIATIHNAGLQVDVHAVGDKGVDWTLEAFAKAAGSVAACRERRHRIEHFPFCKLDSIRRAAELNVPVCEQPLFIEIKADEFLEKLGPKAATQVQKLCPMRTFAREGVHLAYGADVAAFPSHLPMDSIRCAMDRVTQGRRRLDPDEAISFMEALRIHTLGSAYAAFDEKDLGSLEPGKLADFVIWNRDLRQVRTGQDTLALKPEATYVGGARGCTKRGRRPPVAPKAFGLLRVVRFLSAPPLCQCGQQTGGAGPPAQTLRWTPSPLVAAGLSCQPPSPRPPASPRATSGGQSHLGPVHVRVSLRGVSCDVCPGTGTHIVRMVLAGKTCSDRGKTFRCVYEELGPHSMRDWVGRQSFCGP